MGQVFCYDRVLFMKKVTSLLLASFLFLLSPVQAWKQTDENNMSANVIKIINTYPGPWKGWTDGCVNCYKSLAPKSTTKRKKEVKSIAKPKLEKSIRPPCTSGYCECNCGKGSSNFKYENRPEAGLDEKDSVSGSTRRLTENKEKRRMESLSKEGSERRGDQITDKPESSTQFRPKVNVQDASSTPIKSTPNMDVRDGSINPNMERKETSQPKTLLIEKHKGEGSKNDQEENEKEKSIFDLSSFIGSFQEPAAK